MTQYARPSSDITTGWTTTPLWSKIDEVVADDADFITGTGSTVTAECKLSAVTDPLSSANHTWRVRLKATGSSAAEKMTLSLYQGTTLIATLISNSSIVRNAFNEWNGTLTSAQADAITDYSDLRFRFVTGSNGSSETIQCSWAVLEIPDAVQTYDESVSLAGSKSLADSLSVSISSSIALGKQSAMSDNQISTIPAAISALQKALGVGESLHADINSAISLAKTNASQFSYATAGTFDEAISLVKSLSVLANNQSFLSAAFALSEILGISNSSVYGFVASLMVQLSKMVSQSSTYDSSPVLSQLIRLDGISSLSTDSIATSVSLPKSLQQSILSSVIISSIISFSRANGIPIDSEKVFVSVLSLGRSASESQVTNSNIQSHTSISIGLYQGQSSILDALSQLDLSKVSAISLLGWKDLSVSTILSKLLQDGADGTLGIAIIYGSVIIIDTQLARALASDSRLYRVEVRDESV